MAPLKEIVEAWLISFNPSEEQKALAAERIKICNGCEARNATFEVCTKCACPLYKKIYAVSKDLCPLAKWWN